jgi:Uma2 family endonuclease
MMGDMSTATLVSVDEYLATSYRPDCDYMDGELIERNLGQQPHSNCQGMTYSWFRERRRALRLKPFMEMRLRVAERRFRIPDVCVVQLPVPSEPVFTIAPYICVEILSPDDTFPKLQERLDDYLRMGVPNVWVIDPESQRAWQIVREGHLEVLDGILRTTDRNVHLPVADLFIEDDE